MQREYTLNDFLPYKKNSTLKHISEKVRILKLLLFFTKQIKKALTAIKEKKYHYFDAQVSENLCQIRAFYIIETLDNIKISDEDLEAIEKSLSEISGLIKHYSYFINNRPNKFHKTVNEKISINGLLLRLTKIPTLDRNLFILTQLFLLSKGIVA